MADEATLKTEAKAAILKEIAEQAPNQGPIGLLQLAEAYAWLSRPDQSHGGGAKPQ